MGKKKKTVKVTGAKSTDKKKKKKKKGLNAGILFLVPFKGVMIKRLKKKGVKVKSKKLKNVAKQFHKSIIKPRNLEDQFEENIVDDIVKIAKDIFAFLKNLTAKKKKKEPVDKEEEELLKDVETVEGVLAKNKISPDDIVDENGNTANGKKIVTDENGITIGTATNKNGKVLLIAGAAIAALFILKR